MRHGELSETVEAPWKAINLELDMNGQGRGPPLVPPTAACTFGCSSLAPPPSSAQPLDLSPACNDSCRT